jgi:hypothetical protein
VTAAVGRYSSEPFSPVAEKGGLFIDIFRTLWQQLWALSAIFETVEHPSKTGARTPSLNFTRDG